MTVPGTASTAGNGKTAADGGRKERGHGLARAREDECYHITGLIRNCLDEAEHLIDKVNSKATARFTDYNGANASEPLDYAEINRALEEARRCALMALRYIESLEYSGDPYAEEGLPF